MTRLRLMGFAFDALVLLGAALLTIASVPQTYQAEATVWVSAMKPGPFFTPDGPDGSAFAAAARELFRESGAEDRGAELVERDGVVLVVGHDHDRRQAARLANQAVTDLQTEAQEHPLTIDGWTVLPQPSYPAVPPPVKDRTPLVFIGLAAFALAAVIAVRVRRATRLLRTVS